MKIFYKGQKIKSSYKNSEVKSHMAKPMKIIAIYTFDSATPCMPVFSNVYGYLGTDINNGDGTTTRIIRAFDLPTKIDFKDLGSLISVEYLNTSNVTDMNSMFYNCTSLISIDASNWDTSNVTDMAWMFSDCYMLQTLNVTGWDTSNVTTMSSMFGRYEIGNHNLKEIIGINTWDVSNVTDMYCMFWECRSLKSLDLSNWDISNVKKMDYMFCDCESLEILNLDGWHINENAIYSNLFVPYTYGGCKSLINISMNNSDYNSVNKTINQLPTRTSDSMGTLNILGIDDISQVDIATAQSKYWDVIEAYKIVEYKFDNTIADLVPIFNGAFTDYFIVDQVNDNITTRCIYNKKNIITLEKINLTNVGEFQEPYYESNGDIYFDESDWHVVGYNLSKYINGDITISYDMIVSEDSAWTEAYNHIIYSDSYTDYKVFGDKLICESPVEDKIIHFERTYQLNTEDEEQAVFLLEGMGMTIKNLSIKVVNSEFPTKIRFGTGAHESTNFDGREQALLEVLYLDNRNLKTEEQMFQMCINLTKVEGFVSNIMHKTNHMFTDCHNLISIDISNWDTSNVPNMAWMFAGCESLTSLDVSNWDTGNVTSMVSVFYDCISLTSLDISNWDTINVTDMAWMFYDCSNLTSLDVNNWDVSSVGYVYGMFYNCSQLTQLNLNNWDTGNVVDVNGMFNGCSSLTQLDVSDWDTKNVTNMNNMFTNCTKLIQLDLSNWNTGNVTNMSGMFYNCANLTSLNINNWDINNVTDMSYIFDNRSLLNTISMNNSDYNSVNKIINQLPTRTSDSVGTLNIAEVDNVYQVDTTTAQSKYWNVVRSETPNFVLGRSKLGQAKLK